MASHEPSYRERPMFHRLGAGVEKKKDALIADFQKLDARMYGKQHSHQADGRRIDSEDVTDGFGNLKLADTSSVNVVDLQKRIFILQPMQQLYLCSAEDAILKSNHHAAEERVWTNVFYAAIEASRSTWKKSKQGPDQEQRELYEGLLEIARSWYTNLLIELKANASSDLYVAALQSFAQNTARPNNVSFLCRLNIRLGDIARYAAMHLSQDWDRAVDCYMSAMLLAPDNGWAYSQLGYVCVMLKRPLEALAWFCLSLSTSTPKSGSRSNLNIHLNKQAFMFREEHPITEGFFEWYSLLFKKTYEETTTNENYDTFKTSFSQEIKIAFENKEADEDGRFSRITYTVFVILVSTYQLLEMDFQGTEAPQERQIVRKKQAQVMSMMLELVIILGKAVDMESLASRLLGNDTTVLESQTETEPGLTQSEAEAKPSLDTMSILTSFALLVVFLSCNDNFVSKLRNYTTLPLEMMFHRAIRPLVDFTNVLLPFINLDRDTDTLLPHDIFVIGCGSLRPYFASFTSLTTSKYLSPSFDPFSMFVETTLTFPDFSILASRVVTYIRKLGDDDQIEYLRFDVQEGTYIVYDEEYKRRAQYKLSRALAAARLQERVQTLEAQLVEVKKRMVVVEINALVNHFMLIKKWVNARAVVVVIPTAVIQDLDTMKTQPPPLGPKAREVIRWLSLKVKYRSPQIRLQRPEETATLKDVAGEDMMSKTVQSILGCCHWIAAKQEELLLSEKGELILVADEYQYLAELPSNCQISVKSAEDADKWIRRTSKSRRKKR